jgi:hypothetical protein
VLFGLFILLATGAVSFGAFRLIGSSTTKTQLEKAKFELSTTQAQYNKQKKMLERLSERILLTMASKISDPNVNNRHIDTVRDIAEIFKAYRASTYVEGYKFSCTDCTSKDRKNTLELDVAFFNQTASAKFMMSNAENLKNDVINLLKKQYLNVEVKYGAISGKSKQELAKRDIRDKMTITYGNDMDITGDKPKDGKTDTEQPTEEPQPEQ